MTASVRQAVRPITRPRIRARIGLAASLAVARATDGAARLLDRLETMGDAGQWGPDAEVEVARSTGARI